MTRPAENMWGRSSGKSLSTRSLHVRSASILFLAALILTACSGNSRVHVNDPLPSCATFPDYGAAAPRASQTSINLFFSFQYLSAKMAKAIETPSKDSGVHVHRLNWQGGDSQLAVLSMDITAWKKVAGKEVELQDTYVLELRPTPYLITADRVPDAAKRRAILGTGDQGAVIRFELERLINAKTNKNLMCSSRDVTGIDRLVLEGIYGGLADQTPMAMPADQLTGAVQALTNATATPSLQGINLIRDDSGNLKIGFLFGDKGKLFDSTSLLSRAPNSDWGLDIDPALVRTGVQNRVRDEILKMTHNLVLIGDIDVDFTPQGLKIVAHGIVPCGIFSGEFRVFLLAKPRIALAPNGVPVLQVPRSEPDIHTTQARKLCLGLLANPIVIGAPPPQPIPACPDVVGLPISIVVSPGPNDDVLYPSQTNTDGVFFIAGRSTAIDRRVAPRPPIPPC